MSSNAVLKILSLFLIAFVVTACSGGGNSGNGLASPSTPSGTGTPTVQSLTVSITSPKKGDTFIRGQSIQFTASAEDPVDGTLSGDALSWTSSQDGSIGKGDDFALSSLSVGTHTITLQVTDSSGVSASAITSIEVTAISPNVAPAPTAPPIVTNAGYPGTSQITINDPDPGQNHTFAITTFPAHGSADVAKSGTVTYNPAPGFTDALDSLAVTVTDDGSPRMAGSVTIPITVQGPVLNLPPAGTAPKIYTVENTSATTQITVTDPAGQDQPSGTQNHTFSVTTAPQNGTATVSAAGIVTYTPRTGFAGDDNLIVTIQDNGTPPMSGNVLINVTVEKALSFVMTAHPNPVRPGHRVFYSITISNQGKRDITQAQGLTDPTPAFGTVNVAEISGGGNCGVGIVICDNGLYILWQPFGTLSPGDSRTIYLALAVNGSAANVIPPDGTSIHNGANMYYDNGTFVSTSQDVQSLSAAGVMLSLDGDRDPVMPTQQLTYTVTLSNLSTDGVQPINHWFLTATIPEWADFVSADGGGAVANGAVQWDVGTPAPGITLQQHFTVQVKNSVNPGSVLVAEAEVNDSTTGQRYAHDVDTTMVKTEAPLQITMTPGQSPYQTVQAGQPTPYAITLTNTGTTQLTDIALTDVTPNDSEVSNITLGGACYSDASQQVAKPFCTEGDLITWQPLTLDPGASISGLSFTLTPNSGLQDGLLIHNTFRVSYSVGDFSLSNDVVVSQVGGGGPVTAP